MKVFDISLPINNELVVWPGDPPIEIKSMASIADGDSANISSINVGSHTGTHIDAPFHFDAKGVTIDKLPLDLLIGEVRVIEIDDNVRAIDRPILKALKFDDIKRVIFKTGNSKRYGAQFVKDFTALTPDGASLLLEKGIKVVGIDYLSIEAYGSKGHETHHILLDNGIIIIEGLYLKDIKGGDYELIALPLRVEGADGAPARVVLRKGVK